MIVCRELLSLVVVADRINFVAPKYRAIQEVRSRGDGTEIATLRTG